MEMAWDRNPKPTEWAWLAGIVDGEGSIFANWSKSNSRSVRYYSPALAVCMTHEETLSYIHAIFGRQRITSQIPANPAWKKSYIWRVTGYELQVILSGIKPYVVTKKELVALTQEWIALRAKHQGHFRVNPERHDEIIARIQQINSRTPTEIQ